MPKEQRSSSRDRCRLSPYSRGNKNAEKERTKTPTLPYGDENEWKEARCPICIEHPHNAVLLLCASREKGCRPYMCNTSSRHSNCLDQFQKSSVSQQLGEGQQTKLVCPLCRGQVSGWIVVNPARKFMDSKTRSCSVETCDFTGNYSQLRKHARCEHPGVRPTAVELERELEWRNLEEHLERQELFNMQFEFDDYPMDDVSDLASPILDHDLEFMNFVSSFESEFDSVFPDFDWAVERIMSGDDTFNVSSFNELENRGSGRSRVSLRTTNMLSARPRENGSTTSRRNRIHLRPRSNNLPNSVNRQEQVTTLVDFHELSSNLP